MSNPTNIIGHWKSVEDGMPDDDLTCLVWSAYHNEVFVAYRDEEVRERGASPINPRASRGARRR